MENNIIRLHATENRYFGYDQEVPYIASLGNGFMLSEEFRKFMERGLELIHEKIKENGNLGWLVDARRMEVIDPNDKEWVVNHWNIKAYEAGLRFVAFVLPENIFTLMNIEEYTEESTNNSALTIHHFNDVESAKNWLKEVV
ncbi:hypothetical protein JMN32_18275 [Fulvivirga sp. 29W222]|uniref:STAS/SEC14 domain-containing protein n=1 Tax=Fulvivirga marina TaxID=2494733 RepID=A0A937G089_9BACT|nr:hypothetical protein [Fulvivirga marina]MBL6448267.1 hypothetical protein [Fulvivirga marina]